MAKCAELLREGRLGILRIDNPPVNALSPEVISAISTAFTAFEADPELIGLVIECAGRTFVPGADIVTFDDPSFTPAPFNRLLARIEASERPVAAALFGTVLGGGLELALACHTRAAHPATKFGLPEITLGLLPGSLGTQRLPRLIGVARAAEMIVGGSAIGAQDALLIGLIDAVSEAPHAAARKAAGPAAARPLRRASHLEIPDWGDADRVLLSVKADAARRSHLPALAGIAACLDAAVHKRFAEGEVVEAKAFRDLVSTEVSLAMRHIFFAERAARKIPGLPATTGTREICKIGVLGTGTMGAGISIVFANAGFPVTMVETSEAAVARGQAIIDKMCSAQLGKGQISEDQARRRASRLVATTDFSALADVDLVVEAVFEDMALKLDVAARLGKICKPGAIIATNTSTLDVDQIARATGRPADVVGTHFFSPAHVMRLLEVVRGGETAPEVLNTVMRLATHIGKTAVVAGVCYGFIGNRMAEVYGRESEAMQLEGASPEDIDRVAESPASIGLAMGPSRMLDMAGVDVGARTVIEWIKSGEGPQDPAYRALCRALFEAGRNGQKVGEGYYHYEGRVALPSKSRAGLAAELAARHGIAHREKIPDREIFELLFYPMVNEAAQTLSEGIAYRPGDIDVVWTAGYGFPAWRGGPLFMADQIGLQVVVDRMDHYATMRGNDHGYWTVAALLRELAGKGLGFRDWRPPEINGRTT